MAKVIILIQRHPDITPAMALCRGVFTQKKKLWEALEGICVDLSSHRLFDDVGKRVGVLSYSSLCAKLKANGRAGIVDSDDRNLFMVIEAEINKVRPWDIDEKGSPVANPS